MPDACLECGADMKKNLFNDGYVKRHVFYYKHAKSNNWDCPACMKMYESRKDAYNCHLKEKEEFLEYLKKGRHRKYPKDSIGFMCTTCFSYFIGNCRCNYGKFKDPCEQCW